MWAALFAFHILYMFELLVSNAPIDCPFLHPLYAICWFESVPSVPFVYVMQQHFTVLFRTSLKVDGCYGNVWSCVDCLLSTLALHLDFLVTNVILRFSDRAPLLDDDRFFIIYNLTSYCFCSKLKDVWVLWQHRRVLCSLLGSAVPSS